MSTEDATLDTETTNTPEEAETNETGEDSKPSPAKRGCLDLNEVESQDSDDDDDDEQDDKINKNLPNSIYLVESTVVRPCYDVHVKTTSTIYLTKQVAKKCAKEKFISELDSSFRGGQASISGVDLTVEDAENIGNDFISALWNTCDIGGRSGWDACTCSVWKMEKQSDDGYVKDVPPLTWLSSRASLTSLTSLNLLTSLTSLA
eukprot:GHVN01084924.1.p1 GENE.GHVN01084924.1~~GHVN01084924.1.p1  ORF type:complete len:204 (+),score=51.54 GHVN01084924.1:178-789(+)